MSRNSVPQTRQELHRALLGCSNAIHEYIPETEAQYRRRIRRRLDRVMPVQAGGVAQLLTILATAAMAVGCGFLFVGWWMMW